MSLLKTSNDHRTRFWRLTSDHETDCLLSESKPDYRKLNIRLEEFSITLKNKPSTYLYVETGICTGTTIITNIVDWVSTEEGYTFTETHPQTLGIYCTSGFSDKPRIYDPGNWNTNTTVKFDMTVSFTDVE